MSGSSKKSSWSDVIGEMFGGQDRDDEVTRTELVGRTGTMNSRMAAHHSPSNKRDCAAVGVCAKEIKPELNTLDEADFVRDVDKSAYHQLSQFEIDGDNPCSSHLRARRAASSCSISVSSSRSRRFSCSTVSVIVSTVASLVRVLLLHQPMFWPLRKIAVKRKRFSSRFAAFFGSPRLLM
jgi:hypothetical protein